MRHHRARSVPPAPTGATPRVPLTRLWQRSPKPIAIGRS